MKTILFGIALILFGFNCTYVAIWADWGVIQLLGIVLSVTGMLVAVFGFLQDGKK